jgi:hypothetical protein
MTRTLTAIAAVLALGTAGVGIAANAIAPSSAPSSVPTGTGAPTPTPFGPTPLPSGINVDTPYTFLQSNELGTICAPQDYTGTLGDVLGRLRDAWKGGYYEPATIIIGPDADLQELANLGLGC